MPTNLYTSICLIIIRNIPILLLTKLRPYEPETFLLPNDSTVFYEDWCVRYLVNSNKYWNSGVIFIDDSFSFWSFFNAYIMLIRLDVTMAKRKSLNYIFGKQCNESAEIQRHIITEDIYWCALNVSRLSNGNFKSWWETYKRNCWYTKLYINKSILALKFFFRNVEFSVFKCGNILFVLSINITPPFSMDLYIHSCVFPIFVVAFFIIL